MHFSNAPSWFFFQYAKIGALLSAMFGKEGALSSCLSGEESETVFVVLP